MRPVLEMPPIVDAETIRTPVCPWMVPPWLLIIDTFEPATEIPDNEVPVTNALPARLMPAPLILLFCTEIPVRPLIVPEEVLAWLLLTIPPTRVLLDNTAIPEPLTPEMIPVLEMTPVIDEPFATRIPVCVPCTTGVLEPNDVIDTPASAPAFVTEIPIGAP